MALQQEIGLKTGGVLKNVPAALGIAVAFLAFWGMWQISPEPSLAQQDQLLRVREGDSLSFQKDFANTSSGNLQIEGSISFMGNITNYGRMGCGSCKSGRFYLNVCQEKPIYIRGTKPILIYEAFLQGRGRVFLENELQISRYIELDSTVLVSDKNDPGSFLHFLPGASYSLKGEGTAISCWVGKTGQGSFCYPLGEAGHNRHIYLSGKFPKSFYMATYIPEQEAGTDFLVSEGLVRKAGTGLWHIRGAEASQVIFAMERNESHTLIIGYKNGKWIPLNTTQTTHGLSTEKAIIPNEYEAFSLATRSNW